MDLYLAQSSELPADAGEVLCFGWEAYAAARSAGLSARAWEHWFPEASEGETIAAGRALAENWNRRDGRDITSFEGISLGGAYHWLFWALNLLPAYRFVGALDAAVKAKAPRAVRCETSLPRLYRDLLESAGKSRGFEVRWIERARRVGASDAWTPPRLSMPGGKRAALGLANALASLRGEREGPLVWTSYYRSMEPVLDALGRRGGVRWAFADAPPRSRMSRALSEGWRVVLDSWSKPDWGGPPPGEISRMRSDWAACKSEESYRAAFRWRGVDMFGALEPALDDFFSVQTAAAAWACRRLEDAWAREQPAAVLLPFDGPPFQNLLAQLAKKHDRPAIVLLHGLHFDVSQPFTDDAATHILAWGREQKKEYERVKPEGLGVAALGNPAFDRFAPAPARASGGPLRVLAFTRTPWVASLLGKSDVEPELYALEMARALSDLPGVSLSLRLHPSESIGYYRGLLKDFPQVALLQGEPLERCLLDADVVIGTYTTAMLEAMVLGRPVLCVNVSRLAYTPPFDGSWGIAPLTDWSVLRAKIASIAAAPERELPPLLAPNCRILEEFAGPIDGRSAERAAAEIDRLMGGRT